MVMVETSVKGGFMEVPQHPGRGRKPERTKSFARLEAGAHQTRGVQVKEWSQRRSDGLSLAFHPYKSHSLSIGNEILSKEFSEDRCHPTKIPQTQSNHVSRLLQVRSSDSCKGPGQRQIPDDGGGLGKTVWTND